MLHQKPYKLPQLLRHKLYVQFRPLGGVLRCCALKLLTYKKKKRNSDRDLAVRYSSLSAFCYSDEASPALNWDWTKRNCDLKYKSILLNDSLVTLTSAVPNRIRKPVDVIPSKRDPLLGLAIDVISSTVGISSYTSINDGIARATVLFTLKYNLDCHKIMVIPKV